MIKEVNCRRERVPGLGVRTQVNSTQLLTARLITFAGRYDNNPALLKSPALYVVFMDSLGREKAIVKVSHEPKTRGQSRSVYVNLCPVLF